MTIQGEVIGNDSNKSPAPPIAIGVEFNHLPTSAFAGKYQPRGRMRSLRVLSSFTCMANSIRPSSNLRALIRASDSCPCVANNTVGTAIAASRTTMTPNLNTKGPLPEARCTVGKQGLHAVHREGDTSSATRNTVHGVCEVPLFAEGQPSAPRSTRQSALGQTLPLGTRATVATEK